MKKEKLTGFVVVIDDVAIKMKRMKKQVTILMGLMVCTVLAGCDQPTETDAPPPEKQSFEEGVKNAASEFNESAKGVANKMGEEMKDLGDDINQGSKKAARGMKKFGGDVSDAFGKAMDD